jgi:hypothetical protein
VLMPNGDKIDLIASMITGEKRGGEGLKESEEGTNQQPTGWSYMGNNSGLDIYLLNSAAAPRFSTYLVHKPR